MEAVRVPPFEVFYAEHGDPVLAHLRRLLGDGAEDAARQAASSGVRRLRKEHEHDRHA